MMKSKENNESKITAILLIIISTILICILGGCALLSLNYYHLREKHKILLKEREDYSVSTVSLESELADKKSYIEMLEGQLEEKQRIIEALQTREVENVPVIAETESEGQVSGQAIEELAPGTILPYSSVQEINNLEQYFYASVISQGDAVYERIIGKSYVENDNVYLEDLRYLKLLHVNFNHEIQVGEMIVNQDVAEDVLNVFKELFLAEYEIQSIYLVDNYWTGDATTTDTASIQENNTSAFNYREITGGTNLSNHAYGRAIDINPQQNPYIWFDDYGGMNWAHSNADPYVDRESGMPHMILNGDFCYNTFAKYGFSWGGDWTNPKDYQHFDKR